MARRLYPAVLEQGTKGTFGIWFPDFPDCVAAGRSQEEAVEKAEEALARAVVSFAEDEKPLPEPTPLERIERPSRFVAFFIVSVELPNPSERVNVYLPKRLLVRADQMAAEMGMSRSSLFGLAISSIAGLSYAYPGVTVGRKTAAPSGEGEQEKKERPRAKR
jgi:predicted RNase H-like HicB family nuclease